ncbi:hypothetical protein GF391_01405 [Candidatus Uhrbacteria bacterium]|nr:hypothetical protein [Candidatus Uhrbacteria bacterium]
MAQYEPSPIPNAILQQIRPNWRKFAIPNQDAVNFDLLTGASYRFGPCRNNRAVIITSNMLFLDKKDGLPRYIPEEDLEWLEYHSRCPLEDDLSYPQMALTRLELDLTQLNINVADFFNEHSEYQKGLHRDIKTGIIKNELIVFFMPHDGERCKNGHSYKKTFYIHPLSHTRRMGRLSTQIKHYGPNGNTPAFNGMVGEPDNVTALFFGEWYASGERRKSWICFVPIELFEQLYLTWLDTIVSSSFTKHLENYGLRINA